MIITLLISAPEPETNHEVYRKLLSHWCCEPCQRVEGLINVKEMMGTADAYDDYIRKDAVLIRQRINLTVIKLQERQDINDAIVETLKKSNVELLKGFFQLLTDPTNCILLDNMERCIMEVQYVTEMLAHHHRHPNDHTESELIIAELLKLKIESLNNEIATTGNRQNGPFLQGAEGNLRQVGQ